MLAPPTKRSSQEEDDEHIDRTREGPGGRYIPGAIFLKAEIEQQRYLIDARQRGWARSLGEFGQRAGNRLEEKECSHS